VEPVLADRAAHGAGEDAGLQRGHAHLAVELRAPGLLVGLDSQAQQAGADLVAGGRPLARAPLRQVVREPSSLIEHVGVERVLELDVVIGSVHGLARHRLVLDNCSRYSRPRDR
jgi:hypothetical protein